MNHQIEGQSYIDFNEKYLNISTESSNDIWGLVLNHISDTLDLEIIKYGDDLWRFGLLPHKLSNNTWPECKQRVLSTATTLTAIEVNYILSLFINYNSVMEYISKTNNLTCIDKSRLISNIPFMQFNGTYPKILECVDGKSVGSWNYTQQHHQKQHQEELQQNYRWPQKRPCDICVRENKICTITKSCLRCEKK